MIKTYTLKQTRTNARGAIFISKHTGTIEDLGSYFGVQAATIKSLINKINKDYRDQYACCYTQSASVELITK